MAELDSNPGNWAQESLLLTTTLGCFSLQLCVKSLPNDQLLGAVSVILSLHCADLLFMILTVSLQQ